MERRCRMSDLSGDHMVSTRDDSGKMITISDEIIRKMINTPLLGNDSYMILTRFRYAISIATVNDRSFLTHNSISRLAWIVGVNIPAQFSSFQQHAIFK